MQPFRFFIAAIILFHVVAGCASKKPVVRESGLVGTKWRIVYDDPDGHKDHELLFLSGGKISFRHPNDMTPDNDTWSQEGNQITLSVNSGYVIYTGTMEGDRISGSALNIMRAKWNWVATREGFVTDGDTRQVPEKKDVPDAQEPAEQ